MDPKLSPGLCIATKCSIVDPLGPLFYMSAKIFLGGFWHLSQLKFEEISPKIPRMQILRKLAPLLVPFTVPPVPPGGQKNFWEVSGI